MESAPGDLYAQRQESTSEELFQLLHYQHPLLRGCKQHCGPDRARENSPRTLHAEGEGGGKRDRSLERGQRDADSETGRRR